jgi:MarR-like DNA-binding transcriptional regulator SgrR of sgrS sRNA
MRPIRCRWIAAINTLTLCAFAANAARRPQYGGELRVETNAVLKSFEPAERDRPELIAEVFETLVRIDEHGDPQPWLATSWTHDAAHKQWVFSARPNVTLHNGAVWSPPGGVIAVADDKPIDQILWDLARVENAVAVRAADGALVGTGPFRLARFETGKSARLEAHESYWLGRPFLDAVEVRMARPLRDQALDLELGKTDVAEIEVTGMRRLKQLGMNVQAGKPSEILALIFDDSHVPPDIREALALSIDRATIQRVLLDRQGEISGALLPQWLTGFAFVFPGVRDLAKAKARPGAQVALSFGYDREDGLAGSVAERIAVDASEAGIALRLSKAAPDVRLVRLRLSSADAWMDLEDFASVLRTPLSTGGSLYEAEKTLLRDFRLIPLFHLPLVHASGSNVRFAVTGDVTGRFEDLWLETASKP